MSTTTVGGISGSGSNFTLSGTTGIAYLQSLESGLEDYLTAAQDALNAGATLANGLSNLPLIGSAASTSAAQIKQLTQLLSDIQSVIEGAESSINANSTLAASTLDEWLNSTYQNDTLLNAGGLAVTQSISPMTVTYDPALEGGSIELMISGATGVDYSTPFDAHLGMGNLLSLSTSGTISLGAGATYDLGIGYNSIKGAFLDTEHTSLEFKLGGTLSNASAGANIGIVSVSAATTSVATNIDSLTAPSNQASASYVIGLNDTGTTSGGMLYFSDLNSSSFTTTPSGNYNVDLSLVGEATGYASLLPAISTELLLTSDSLAGGSFSNPTIQFLNTSLNLGTYFSGYINEALRYVNNVLSYVTPVTNILTQPIGLLSSIGAPDSLLALAKAFASDSNNPSFLNAVNFVTDVVNFVNVINSASQFITDSESLTGSVNLNLGSYTLNPGGNSSLASLSSSSDVLNSPSSSPAHSSTNTISGYSTLPGAVNPSLTSTASGTASTSGLTSQLQNDYNNFIAAISPSSSNGGWSIPLLTPSTALPIAFELLTGNLSTIESNPFTLLQYSFPFGTLSASTTETYNIYGPLAVFFSGSAALSGGLTVGYTSKGITDAIQFGANNPLVALDGLYIAGTNNNGGTTSTLATVTGTLSVGGGINVVVASASAGGSITASASLSTDPSYNSGQDSVAGVNGGVYLFNTGSFQTPFSFSGAVTAGAYAEATIGWPPFGYTWTWNSPQVTLWSASTSMPSLVTPPTLGYYDGNNYVLNTDGSQNGIYDFESPVNIQLFPSGTISSGEQFTALFTVNPPSGSSGNDSTYGATVTLGDLGTVIATLGSGDNILISSSSLSADLVVTSTLSGNNQITGGAGNDFISLGDGDNYLNGGNGRNTLIAGDGNNQVLGGSSLDFITLGDGDNTFIGASGGNSIVVGTGSNKFNLVAGHQTIVAASGGTNYVGFNQVNNAPVYLDLLNSVSRGAAEGDVFSGIQQFQGSCYDIENTLIGGTVPVTLQGGNTLPGAILTSSGSYIQNTTLVGNTLVGNSAADYFIPGSGLNSIIGNAVEGKSSNYTVDFQYLTEPVQADLLNGFFGGGASNDTVKGIQNIIGTSYQYAGGSTLSPSLPPPTIQGGSTLGSTLLGNWKLQGDSLFGESAGSLIGGNADTVCYNADATVNQSPTLSMGADSLAGSNGNNLLIGNGGVLGDTLVTYRGKDSIYGNWFNASGATIEGLGRKGLSNVLGVIDWSGVTQSGAGYGAVLALDSLGSLAGGDSLGGDAVTGAYLAYLSFHGTSGNNVVNLANTLGLDTIVGGPADDILSVSLAGGDNSLIGGGGHDVLAGSAGPDTLTEGDGANSGGSSTMSGGGGSNIFTGGSGSTDSLYGATDVIDFFNGGFSGGDFASPNRSDITAAANDTVVGSSTPGSLVGFTLEGGNSLVAANFSNATAPVTLTGNGSIMAPVTAAGGTRSSGLAYIGNAVLGSGNNVVDFTNTRAEHNIWSGSGTDTFKAGFGGTNFYGGGGNDLLQVDWSANTFAGGDSVSAGMMFTGNFGQGNDAAGYVSAYYGSLPEEEDQLLFSGMGRLSAKGTPSSDYMAVNANYGWGNATLDGGGGSNTLYGGHDSADSLFGASDVADLFFGGFTGGGFINPNRIDITSAANDTVVGPESSGSLSGFALIGGSSLAAANFVNVSAAYTLTANGTNMTLTAPGGTNVTNVDFIGNAVLGSGNNVVDFTNTRADHNIWGGSGNDTFRAGFGGTNFYGGGGADLLQVDWSANTYSGGDSGMVFNAAFSASLTAAGVAAAAYGTLPAQKDRISFSGMKRLAITGTSANDTLSLTASSGWGEATLAGGGGSNTLLGGHDSRDSLSGVGDGADSFSGGFTGGGYYNPNRSDITSAAADTVVGSSVTGYLNGFSLIGGNSLSAANFSGVTAPYTLTGNGTNMTLTAPGGTSVTNVAFIGNAVLGSGNNVIEFTGQRAAHNIWGGSGNDTIAMGYGQGNAVGGGGNDLYILDWSANTYQGGVGQPAPGMSLTATSSPSSGFSGNASAAYSSLPGGRDLMNFSGMQQLRITGTPSADYLVVTSGSGSGSVTLDAGNGNNTLLGGAGSRDFLVGGTGNDSIAGTGNDTLRGGGGTNTYVVSSTSNLISDEGTGSVILSSVPFSLASSLVSGVHSLVYTGLSPAMLTGSVQSDSLRVRMGNDTLSGCPAGPNPGRGQIDTLTGGSGADLYVLGTKAGGAFYRSGGSPGNQDYAQITAFTVSQDRLQLAGKKSDYVLGASGVGGLSGQGLFLDLNHNGKIDPSDDLIAVLQSGNATALTSANTVGKALFV